MTTAHRPADLVDGKKPGYSHNRYKPGDKFGRLTMLSRDGRERWRFRCDCGTVKSLVTTKVTSGDTKSCGCLKSRRNNDTKKFRVEYNCWRCMLNRCYQPKTVGYKHWGGRGITVCGPWRESFDAFRRDMGPKPSRKHSIDRINNDGNYEPTNCRWATPKQQSNNKRQGMTKAARLRRACAGEGQS